MNTSSTWRARTLFAAIAVLASCGSGSDETSSSAPSSSAPASTSPDTVPATATPPTAPITEPSTVPTTEPASTTASPTTEVTAQTTIPPPAPAGPPPPTCARFADVISTVVGNPTSVVDGTDIVIGQQPAIGRCFGTVAAPPDGSANNRSAVWEGWVFEVGALPDELASGSSPYTTPASFTVAEQLGVGVSATPADLVGNSRGSVARRAVRFGCGGFECWLYLEVGAFAPPDPDTALLDANLTAIISSLIGSDPPT